MHAIKLLYSTCNTVYDYIWITICIILALSVPFLWMWSIWYICRKEVYVKSFENEYLMRSYLYGNTGISHQIDIIWQGCAQNASWEIANKYNIPDTNEWYVIFTYKPYL